MSSGAPFGRRAGDPRPGDLLQAFTRVGVGATLGLAGWAADVVREAARPDPLAIGPGATEAAGVPGTGRSAEAPTVIDVTDAAASRGTASPSDGVVLALADLERQRVERLAGASRSRPTPADASAADLGHVALGALFVAQDRARDAVGLVRSAGVRLAPPARRMWASRPVAPVRAMVDERLQQLDARGRVEEQLSRRAGSRAFTQVVDGVTQSDEVIGIVDEVVDKVIGPVLDTTLPLVFDRLRSEQDAEALVALVNDIVDRVLGPVLDTALPVVMNRLNEDPSAVRDLVRDQSTSIAGELADSVRTRTVTADDRLERLVNRFRPSRRGEDARP